MVRSRDDIEGLDAAILMHPRTWEASGHVAGFVDPVFGRMVKRNGFLKPIAQTLEAADLGELALKKGLREMPLPVTGSIRKILPL